MATVKVYLRQHSKETNKGIVWVSFYVNRQFVNMTTGVVCEKKDWNDTKKLVKSSDKEYKDKNLIIDRILSRVNDVFVKFRLRNKTLTRESFLRAYNRPDDFPPYVLCAHP